MKTLNFIFSAILCVNSFQALALDENVDEQIRLLDWKSQPGVYPLSGINSSITIINDESLVTGKDASNFIFLVNGTDSHSPSAVVLHPYENETVQIFYSFHDIDLLKWTIGSSLSIKTKY